MRITGAYPFTASPEQVWRLIRDPAALKASIPQCESMTQLDETHWQGSARVKIGPVSTLFKGDITLSNLVPPHSYTIGIKATSWLGQSSGSADVSLQESESGTILHYTAEVLIGIKALDKAMDMASGLARTLADKFFARLAEGLNKGTQQNEP